MTVLKPPKRGRPFSATPAQKISVTVSWDNWEGLRLAENKSKVINKALKEYFK